MPAPKPKSKLKQNPSLFPMNKAATVAVVSETVAEVAYARYLRRGGGHGYDVEDWLEAERMLRERL